MSTVVRHSCVPMKGLAVPMTIQPCSSFEAKARRPWLNGSPKPSRVSVSSVSFPFSDVMVYRPKPRVAVESLLRQMTRSFIFSSSVMRTSIS